MNPELPDLPQALQYARQAIRQGDRKAARQWAERAAALDPRQEEAWLILAAVASPRASLAYLEQVLQINPGSERARKGLEWARNRLDKVEGKGRGQDQPLADTQPVRRAAQPEPKPGAPPQVGTPPRLFLRRQVKVSKSPPEPVAASTTSISRSRFSYLTAGIILLCALAAVFFWPGNTSPALAFLHGVQDTPDSSILFDLVKPSHTPTYTPTFTPTPTFTNTPTFTSTFTPTDTPTPTLTFTPTDTPWPTSTPFLPPTQEPSSGGSGGVHWIDVDLSDQMLYAYEGDTIVASFLVSTGVWQYPTVVGQFYIYMKFEYTLMAGDGYYLPDVPYTMYFYRGYGIHGTYWHSNFGTPMSHGCVNMYTPDAEWLFYWAPMGTLVNIHY